MEISIPFGCSQDEDNGKRISLMKKGKEIWKRKQKNGKGILYFIFVLNPLYTKPSKKMKKFTLNYTLEKVVVM